MTQASLSETGKNMLGEQRDDIIKLLMVHSTVFIAPLFRADKNHSL